MRSIRSFTIGLCGGLLLLGRIVSGQLPSPGDGDPSGRVYAKVVVTITGESGAFGHPASGLRFLVVAEDGDRVSIRTNDAGVASTWLFPGSYRFVTPDPFSWDGNAYTWDAVVAIRPGTGVIKLSQANASKIVALTSIPAGPVGVVPSAFQSRSPTEGFHLGIALNGSAIQVDDQDFGRGDTESGAGVNLDLGYNFASNFGILFTVAAANISSTDGDYTLGQADFAARYSFSKPAQSFVPYLELGFTGISAVSSNNVELSGYGGTGAIGFSYFFTPKVALDLNLRNTRGSITTLKVGGTSITTDNGLGVNASRLNVGVEFFPGGR